MSVASSWLDIVVGIDFHIELVPTPAPTPIPFPHPHCSVIWDPVGYVIGEVTGVAFAALVGAPIDPAGPVLVGGSMGTVVGDAASMPIKHILMPPGTTFVVGLPPSDAELVFGSQSVTFRGASAVRAGDVALPCSEPVRLPTGAVVSIPKAPSTTLVGGPPAMSLGSVAAMLGGRALRTKWASAKLHKVVQAVVPEKLQRLRRLAHKSVCFFTGHPVNVATGGVTTSAVDFTLPGPIPLRLERDYDTNWFDRKGPLGHGWSHALDGRLWIEEGRVVVLMEDGRELEFPTRALHEGVAREGDELWHPVQRATLRSLGHHRWTLRGADGLTRTFGPVAGEPHDDARRGCSRLISVANATGDRIEFSYDAQARLQEITDCGGRIVGFEHDAADRLRRVWLPAPDGNGLRQHAEYRYDDAGDLVEVKDAAGNATRFEYDRHLLVRETDRNGLSFYFKYDGYGRFARCIRTWGDGGLYDHVIDYDRPGRTTLVTNSLGECTVYACNPLGLVETIVRPNGSEIGYEYDVTTRLIAETDELGQVTRHEYDARGNRVQTTSPDGAVTRFEFDDSDRKVARVDPDGGRWEWHYDSVGTLVGRTDPRQLRTRYVHEGGVLTAVVDPAGQTTRLAWDERRCLQQITGADGTTVQRRHDALGRLVELTDAGGNTQRRRYDAVGRLVRVEEPDGNVRELAWDGEGNLVRARDRLRDVTLQYVGLGKLAARTVGGKTVRYDYDTEGQLVGVHNEAGHVHRLERGPGGQVVAEVAFDELTKRYEHDAAGRVTKVVRPGASRFSDIAYDPAGRVVKVDHSDGGFESYAYDALGRLLEADNQHARVALARDARGRVVREATTVGETTRTIDSKLDTAGRRVGVRSSLGADVTIERNPLGDVMRISQHGEGFAAWEATISRNALGQEVDRQLPGGARSYWWRDTTGRPTQHWAGRSDASARTRKYAWAPGGRVTGIDDEGFSNFEFGYDLAGALVKATHDDGRVEHRASDDVGNLFASLGGEDRDYGRAGEILKRRSADGVTSYRYDEDGNLAEREDPDGGCWQYHWDAAGCLVKVDRPDGTAVAMRYDAFGRRIQRNHDGVATEWLWDGDRKLHEWGAAAEPVEPTLSVEERARVRFLEESRARFEPLYGDEAEARWRELLDGPTELERAHAVVRARVDPRPPPDVDETIITWMFEPGTFAPIARLTSDEAHSIVCDHTGAPLVVFDAEAGVAARLSYDSNGAAEVQGDASLCPFRFAGQYDDPQTGLHENRYRYYDPAIGRYLSRDPLGLRGGLAQYAYVADPLTTIDPLGLAARPTPGSACDGAASARETWTATDDGLVLPPTVDVDAVATAARDPRNPIWGQVHGSHSHLGDVRAHAHGPEPGTGRRIEEELAAAMRRVDQGLKSGSLRPRRDRRDKGGP
ncbi:MAG: DUF6531 domain-containing protein [Myxococcota bacterium]